MVPDTFICPLEWFLTPLFAHLYLPAMLRHGLANLLTFNKPDFERFAGIQVFTPAEILAGLMPN